MDVTKKTFQLTRRGRGCAEFGPHCMTFTDTIYADGRVVSRVVGHCDGEHVNQSREWAVEGAVDFDRIVAARIASGWSEVSS